MDFGRVLEGFWEGFGSKSQPNSPTTKIAKTLKNTVFYNGFLLLRPCHVEVKINKNAANNPSKTTLKSTSQLASILQPTWLHFGRVLGAKLEPSWHQIAPKVDPKSDQKNDHLFDGLWMDF